MIKVIKVVLISNITVLAVLALLPALLITNDIGLIESLIEQISNKK